MAVDTKFEAFAFTIRVRFSNKFQRPQPDVRLPEINIIFFVIIFVLIGYKGKFECVQGRTFTTGCF
ncbi:MAG: hypothetical protein JO250_00545 [Armatimonadetes bacterium]|nr:hypothetical protein [Armatimonadota bacterium]